MYFGSRVTLQVRIYIPSSIYKVMPTQLCMHQDNAIICKLLFLIASVNSRISLVPIFPPYTASIHTIAAYLPMILRIELIVNRNAKGSDCTCWLMVEVPMLGNVKKPISPDVELCSRLTAATRTSRPLTSQHSGSFQLIR